MQLGTIMTISCILSSVTMLFFIGGLLLLARFGGQGIGAIFERFTGGGNQPQQQPVTAQTAPHRKVTSQSLRDRARNLDFPAPDGAPAQASLRARGAANDPLAQPMQAQQAQQFQPSTPSLSPSRPFSGGQFNSQAQQPLQQGGQFNQQQQPLQQGGQFNSQQQPLQQGGQFNQQQQPLQQGGQFNQQQQRPQQPLQQGGQFNQQQQQRPQQQPLQQGGQFNQQQQRPQQPPPPPGLTPYVPDLRSSPRPHSDEYTSGPGLRRNRDGRKGDDYDRIYDDQGGGGGIMDDVGDLFS